MDCSRRTFLLATSGLTLRGASSSRRSASIQFEKTPRALAEGRSLRLLTRRQHGLLGLYSHRGNLYFIQSADLGDTWSPPQQVNSQSGEVSDHGENSAFLLTTAEENILYAIWNCKDPSSSSGSHLKFSRSLAMRPEWSPPVIINDHQQPVSHSFQGAAVGPEGEIVVAWLDGRERPEMGAHHGHTGSTATLCVSVSRDQGRSWSRSIQVADQVCPCCRAAVAFTGGRIHVSWRGVDEGDVRDIYVASSADGGQSWSPPVPVARDGWRIKGCPHVGAAMATFGGHLYIAWFTEAGDQPAIYLSRSSDGGRSFATKQLVSGGAVDPTHPFLVADEKRLVVVFQARASKRGGDSWGAMRVFYRELTAAGLSPLMALPAGQGPASYPSAALGLSGRTFISWTETDKQGTSQIVLLRGRSSRITTRPAES